MAMSPEQASGSIHRERGGERDMRIELRGRQRERDTTTIRSKPRIHVTNQTHVVV